MNTFDPQQFAPAQPHAPILKIDEGLYLAPGSFRLAPLMRISRNMVVVREDDVLTLVNPIRLSADGEAQLEALGTVQHVVRLGAFHAADDAYTVARFNAQYWSQPHSTNQIELKPDQILSARGPLPLKSASLFEFSETARPECALLIHRGNGTLITCDGLQHYGDYSRHSLLAKICMPLLGFPRTVVIGPMWKKALTKENGSLYPDFERLSQLPFDCLVSAHGTPLMAGAHAAVSRAIAAAFKQESD